MALTSWLAKSPSREARDKDRPVSSTLNEGSVGTLDFSVASSPSKSTKGGDLMMDELLADEAAITILDQNERIKRFGIECLGPQGDGIFFKAGTWRPGGEYVQKLIIRNVSTTVKKLKYKLPSTRYFSLAYPEVIILSPGMFKEIDVIFRPTYLSTYLPT